MKTRNDFIRNLNVALTNVMIRSDNRKIAYQNGWLKTPEDFDLYNERLSHEVDAECEKLNTLLTKALSPS